MNDALDKTWHLAKTDDEITLTEFEFSLWRALHAFSRWQEDCFGCVSNHNLNGNEVAVLNIIKMRNRPKTVYDISRLLNRSDMPNILYSIRKLVTMKLIEKAPSNNKKVLSYQATTLGGKIIDDYVEVRKNVLIKMLSEFKDVSKLGEIAKLLTLVTGIYDEAGRIAATYKQKIS